MVWYVLKHTHREWYNTCTVHTLQQRSYLLIFWIVNCVMSMRNASQTPFFPFLRPFPANSIQNRVNVPFADTRAVNICLHLFFSPPHISFRCEHTQLVLCVVLTTPLPSSARVHSYTHTNTFTQTHDDNPNEENKNENGGGKLALCSSSFMLIWFAVYHECSYIFTWCFACE